MTLEKCLDKFVNGFLRLYLGFELSLVTTMVIAFFLRCKL